MRKIINKEAEEKTNQLSNELSKIEGLLDISMKGMEGKTMFVVKELNKEVELLGNLNKINIRDNVYDRV